MRDPINDKDWKRCRRCRLYRTRRNVVLTRFGYTIKGQYVDSETKIPTSPTILFLGEAPGAQEDHSGIPFSGASGRILHQIFKLSGANFNYAITNLVGCRPSEEGWGGRLFNRTPSSPEIEACSLRLDQLVNSVEFDGVVYLGNLASNYRPKTHLGPSNLFFRALTLTCPATILRMEYKLYTMKLQARSLSRYVDSTTKT